MTNGYSYKTSHSIISKSILKGHFFFHLRKEPRTLTQRNVTSPEHCPSNKRCQFEFDQHFRPFLETNSFQEMAISKKKRTGSFLSYRPTANSNGPKCVVSFDSAAVNNVRIFFEWIPIQLFAGKSFALRDTLS